MPTKRLAALVLVLMSSVAVRADDPTAAEVEKAIKALNDAFEAGNADAIKALVTPDHVAITPYYGGRQTVADQIKSLPDLKLTEYDAGRLQIKRLGDDVAIASYTLTQKGTFRGKEVPPKCLTSAVWVRQGGKWREAHYQETAADGK